MSGQLKGYALKGAGIAVIVLLLLQALPFLQPDNPPVVNEPAWDRPETRALAKRACFDCHSNETFWPWYAKVAPMSWLVVYDVRKGRSEFNFSNWHAGDISGRKADEEIRDGKMPLPRYLLLHPEARLTDAEKTELRAGLLKTMTAKGPEATVVTGKVLTEAGAILLDARCSVCHSADRAKRERKSRNQWEETVTRMMANGALLSGEEKVVLIDYLAKTYGP
ncbi:MAG: heme-binding domain-containing protein [Desulfuromonadales bacterium]|nr:heme-binding domain-containing protein [Desulfuromonadales bacterium]